MFAAVASLLINHALHSGEVRGVWMTTTSNSALAGPREVERSMANLKRIGINTVYVEAWKNGYTQFPSSTLLRRIGVDRHPNLGKDRDLLQEAVTQAHRNGLACIAWFEYGFMAAHKDTINDLRKKFPQWMMTTHEGSLVSEQNPFVWMNPLRTECQDLLLGIIKETVVNYDLDGIQLDDRIAWPVTMGYDDFTSRVYRLEHGGNEPPTDSRDPGWIRWRADKVSNFAQRLFKELKAIRPNLVISISPAVFPWSLENYSCDWPEWQARGWMNECVPQIYRDNFESFAATLAQQKSEARGPIVAGLLVDSPTRSISWQEVESELNLLRQKNIGHVFWYSRGLMERFQDQAQAYYLEAGPASNPNLPPNWRPHPLFARRVCSTRYQVGIPSDGMYQILLQSGQNWTNLEPRLLKAGELTLDVPYGIKRVELIVDRRETRL